VGSFNLVVHDEFDIRDIPALCVWKKLVEGLRVNLNFNSYLALRCPYIMISPYAPSDLDELEKCITRRCKVVEARRFDADEFEHIPITYLAYPNQNSRVYSHAEIKQLDKESKLSFNNF